MFVIRQFVSTDPSGQLFEAYYNAYPEEVLTQMRSTAEESRSDDKARLIEGLQAYKTKNFEAAASQIQAYLQEQPNDLIARFYLGMTYMELKQFDQAQQTFEPVIEARSTYYEEASWYNALSLLKQNEKTKAEEQLQLITQEGKSRFVKPARELAGQLKN
jgi:tetratricopeptide (TPR) repeat protein